MIGETNIGDYMILVENPELPLPVSERIVRMVGNSGIFDAPIMGLDMGAMIEAFYAVEDFERMATPEEALAAEQRNAERIEKARNAFSK